MVLHHAGLQAHHLAVPRDDAAGANGALVVKQDGQESDAIDRQRHRAEPEQPLDQRDAPKRRGVGGIKGVTASSHATKRPHPHHDKARTHQRHHRHDAPLRAHREAKADARQRQTCPNAAQPLGPAAALTNGGGHLPQGYHTKASHNHIQHGDAALYKPRKIGKQQHRGGLRGEIAPTGKPHCAAERVEADTAHQR